MCKNWWITELSVFLLLYSRLIRMFETNIKRKNRWFDGGLAASGACCFTHPLDLLKVHLQTTGGTGKLGIVGQTAHIIRSQGALAMFNGLSASVLRNLTYSTTRFAIYGKGVSINDVTLFSVIQNLRFFCLNYSRSDSITICMFNWNRRIEENSVPQRRSNHISNALSDGWRFRWYRRNSWGPCGHGECSNAKWHKTSERFTR